MTTKPILLLDADGVLFDFTLASLSVLWSWGIAKDVAPSEITYNRSTVGFEDCRVLNWSHLIHRLRAGTMPR